MLLKMSNALRHRLTWKTNILVLTLELKKLWKIFCCDVITFLSNPHVIHCQSLADDKVLNSKLWLKEWRYYFFKWVNPGLFLLVLFTFQFKWQIYNLNNINRKKRWLCAWYSNPGWQDGRCRWIHWAMAAPQWIYYLLLT